MLVLSRKIGEKIVIDGGITLVVKRIVGQRVTFGIEAPDTVRIIRGELKPFEQNDGLREREMPAPPENRQQRGIGPLNVATGLTNRILPHVKQALNGNRLTPKPR